MLIDWSDEFDDWLDRLEAATDADPIAARRLNYVIAQLQVLQELERAPEHEAAVLKFYNSVGSRADAAINRWKAGGRR